MMEAITELGGKRASTVSDLFATMREVKKRVEVYEERLKPFPDAKTTWIPSTLIRLLNRECLSRVRKAFQDGVQRRFKMASQGRRRAS